MQFDLASFIGIASLLIGQVSTDCPTHWTRYDRSCYFLSHDEETWIGAHRLCERFKAHLVEVNDDKENNFLTNFTAPVNSLWMGATDLEIEGEWLWSNSQEEVKYANWRSGEPNNGGLEENCMQREAGGLWNDGTCRTILHYICEKPYS